MTADMLYESTRGQAPPCPFPGTLLRGSAPDGGLYVPVQWPQLTQDDLTALRSMMRYRDVAHLILGRFVDAKTRRNLMGMLKRAYTRKKFGSAVVPVRRLDADRYLLRVSQGPTWAFKDMALQLFAEMLDFWLKETDAYLNIIVATSGDTGSAAIAALRGRRRIRIIVLSPGVGNMSDTQKLQMYGVKDKRVHNIVIDGNFDDAQAIVKAILNDEAFRELHKLGAANSINWARIIFQTVYFAWGWSRLAKSNDQQVSFAVPTGNFGDVYACYAAKRVGIPIKHIIVATNQNDVLDRFFKTGRYDARVGEKMVPTLSPSMDIKVASNFERLLADAFERDSGAVRLLMDRMKEGGPGWFDISDVPEFSFFSRMGFVSGSCTDIETQNSIRHIYGSYKLPIDPHTATAVHVGWRFREPGVPLVFVETARWEKFPITIRTAIRFVPDIAPRYQLKKLRPRVYRCAADTDIVKRHIETCLR